MDTFLLILTVIISGFIIFFILIQGKGAGLGSAWGGGGELYQTRRGVEKITLRLTVILIVAFFIISLIKLF